MVGDRSAPSGRTPTDGGPNCPPSRSARPSSALPGLPASSPAPSEQVPSSSAPSAHAPIWSDLPPAARTAAVSLAARALSTVPADQLPVMVRPVARFTVAKRARRGALPLTRTLAADDAFRAVIAQHLPPVGPQDSSDPADAVARAFFLRLPLTDEQQRDLALSEQVEAQRARIGELSEAVEILTARLAAVGAWESRNGRAGNSGVARAGGGDGSTAADDSSGPVAPGDDRRGCGDLGVGPHGAGGMRAGEDRDGDQRGRDDGGRARGEGELRAEADKLRRRLREQGARHRRAALSAEAAVAAAETARDVALAEATRHRADAERWRRRAEQDRRDAARARDALDRARHAESQSRADADRRIELLLDAVEGAAAGLRREWRLSTTGRDPADVAVNGGGSPDRRRGRSVDGALLTQWLGLPEAHLIIDGYNVTKTGYPDLTLAEQRDRLIRSLAPLAARTGAEITVVFDGADVVAPAGSTHRVRVVFSPPGVIADDVVRDLAAAEPRGRIVVVVSADREVADGARRSGARTAPSSVLLEILS